MSAKPETKIVNAIQEYVENVNGNALKLHGNSMQRQGEPDLIGGMLVMYEGIEYTVHFAIECKQPGENPRPLQVHRLEQWAKVGYCTGVAHSLDEFLYIIDSWVREQAHQDLAVYMGRHSRVKQ